MIGAERGLRHEPDVLLRQLDRHLTGLRSAPDRGDAGLAERIAAALRRLVVETASASAADRARVRVAVHLLVGRDLGGRDLGGRDGTGRDAPHNRRKPRSLAERVRAVNDIMYALDRADLAISGDGAANPR